MGWARPFSTGHVQGHAVHEDLEEQTLNTVVLKTIARQEPVVQAMFEAMGDGVQTLESEHFEFMPCSRPWVNKEL